MNVDALSQIMDGASFILVTPEFLAEERLTSIRKAIMWPIRILCNVSRRLGGRVLSDEELDSGSIPWRSVWAALFAAFLYIALIHGKSFPSPGELISRERAAPSMLAFVAFNAADIVGYVLMTLALSVALLNFTIFVLLLAEKIAARGILFGIGAALFVFTRAMLFLHYT